MSDVVIRNVKEIPFLQNKTIVSIANSPVLLDENKDFANWIISNKTSMS